MRGHDRPRRTARLATGAFAGLACAVAAAGCGSPPEDAAAAPTVRSSDAQLQLGFDDLEIGSVVEPRTTLRSTGQAALDVRLRTAGGGVARAVRGVDDGTGLRLPRYVPGPEDGGPNRAPLAVLAVLPLSLAPPHPLDPGSKPFVFGASFRLDLEAGGTEADNGNNLVQRGGFTSDAQYKIQIDKRQPSCRVAGADGVLFATSPNKVEAGLWYDVTCRRVEDGLELVVVEHDPEGGEGVPEVITDEGPTGDLSGMPPAMPLTIGGKLNRSGDVAADDSDQFNGVVDDVFLHIDP